MKPLFCNKCHKRIMPPKFIDKIKMIGSMKINCGDGKCKGHVTIKGTKESSLEQIPLLGDGPIDVSSSNDTEIIEEN